MFQRSIIPLLLIATIAHAQDVAWDEPRVTGGTTPDGLRLRHLDADIASGGNGLWVSVWYVFTSADASDGDIASARSTDNGATWSTPQYVNNDATTDNVQDTDPAIAHGGGTFIAAWMRKDDDPTQGCYIARSTDGGQSWSARQRIVVQGVDDSNAAFAPAIASDGKGTWTVVCENDGGLVTVRSTDDGLSWDTPQSLIIRERDITVPDNNHADIATDGAGNWRIIWSHFGLLFGSISDRDIAFSVSSDNGATWSAPALIHPSMNSDSVFEADSEPTIATNGKGRWVCAWLRSDCCSDAERTPDILRFSVSTQNSTTWSTPTNLRGIHNEDIIAGFFPDIAADTSGNWFVTFESPSDTTQFPELDIGFVESNGNGFDWSPSGFVNAWATTDDGSLDSRDARPAIATDGNGVWITNWHSRMDPENIGFSDIIWSASTQFTGRVTGFARDAQTDNPIACAAIRLIGRDPKNIAVKRIITTGKNGEFAFENVPEGVYDLILYAPGYPRSMGVTAVVPAQASFVGFQPNTSNASSRITGAVTDAATNEPITGVLVEAIVGAVVVADTYTCGDGGFELTNVLTRKGGETNVTVRAATDNYITNEVQVTIAPNEAIEQNIALTKAVNAPASLAGRVVEQGTANGIANARVTLEGRGPVSTETAPDGTFAFDTVVEGQYTVSASAPGYLAKSTRRAIGINDFSNIEIALGPGALNHPADLDNNNRIDAIDVQRMINIVLGLITANGDVNNDGQTNATDIQRVINAALGLG